VQSSAAGPSHAPPDDDDIVVLTDDGEEPPAPPPARSSLTPFVNAMPLQSTSSAAAPGTSAKAGNNGQREESPMSTISPGSSPPSLDFEQDVRSGKQSSTPSM
jgi:hypothetical protein